MDEKSEVNSIVTVKCFMGDEKSIKKINEQIKAGKHIIFIGNIEDFCLAKVMSADCKGLDAYIGYIRKFVEMGSATYIPGEKDLQLCTELDELIKSCNKRKSISQVTCVAQASDLKQKASDLQNRERNDIAMIIDEIHELIKPNAVEKRVRVSNYHGKDQKGKDIVSYDDVEIPGEKQLVLNSNSNTYLGVMKNLAWIRSLPFYKILKDSEGQSVLFSHQDSSGRVLSQEEERQLTEKTITLGDLVEDMLTVKQNRKNNTLRQAQSRVDLYCGKYLSDPAIVTTRKQRSPAAENTER